LAEVFGADYSGHKIEPYQAVQMMLANPEHFSLQPWENPCVTVSEPALAVTRRKGAKELAGLHVRYGPSDRPGELPVLRNAFVKSEPVGPAMIENHYGKGRCLYFAPKVFSAYAFNQAPEIRKVTAGKLLETELASGPVRLDGPACIRLIASERPEKGEWIIHLINYQASLGDVYDVYTTRKLPLSEEVLPVYDVKLILNPGERQVKKARAIIQACELEIQRRGHAWEIEVPKICVHEIIVIRFAKSWDGCLEKVSLRDPLQMTNYVAPKEAVIENVDRHFSDHWSGEGEGQY
jgi:hypothetical protein